MCECVCLVQSGAESRLVPLQQLHVPMTDAVFGEGKLEVRLRYRNGNRVCYALWCTL